ncbi:MAG TPA: MFS transporter [Burkholderiales bacterium]
MSAASPGLSRGLLALLALATFLGAATIHYQTPMLGAFALEFGADASAVGWVATLTFGGFLAGFILVVPLGDRYDKRRLILFQLSALIVALLLEAAAPNLVALAAGGFVIGLCACFSQSIVPLVADLARPEVRGRTLGTLLSALFLGILFGRVAGGQVATLLGWRWMYLLAAAVFVLLMPVLVARLPHSEPRTSLSYGELMHSMVALVRDDPAVRRIAAVQLLLGICYGGFWATIAPMLLATHGLGPASAGLVGIPGAAGILIARPAGRWMDARGAGPVVTIGIATIMLAWLVFALGLWWFAAIVGGAVLLDCGLRAVMVSNQTLMNSLSAQARSRSNTIFGVNVWGGNALGAFLASTALAHGGWLAVCTLAFLASLTALLLQILLPR